MGTPRFAIRYADGSVHEGGGPEDVYVEIVIRWPGRENSVLRVSRDWMEAPYDRVLMVIVEKPHRQVLRATRKDNSEQELFGAEWYYPVEDGEYGFADDLGAWLRKLGGAVKRGEYVSSEQMAVAWAWAKGYTRIPRP